MDSRPVPPVFLPSLAGTSVRRGVWSADEHDRFLQALKRFPDGPWQQLALCVGTRSTRQVQTHAQKYFEKIRRRQRGLRRSYVHTGVAREHRVDDDLVAILSAMPASDQADEKEEEEDGDSGDEGDGDGDDDGDDGVDEDEDEADSGQEEKASATTTTSVPSTTTSPRGRTSRATGKKRKRRSTQENKATEEPPKTLPRRIRIRRSARNALQIAASREQLYLQAIAHGISHVDASAGTSIGPSVSNSSLRTIDPVEPTRADLPSIEEALDFFLTRIDGAESVPSHRPFAGH